MRVLTIVRVLINNLVAIFCAFKNIGQIKRNHSKFIAYNIATGRELSFVISLTSYPARYNILYYTLISLLSQKSKYIYVVDLWIARSDYDSLPRKIQNLQHKYNGFLNIKKCEDYGSLKKIESFSEYANGLQAEAILTADDDLYYPSHWLSLLVNGFITNNLSVFCCRARILTLASDSQVEKYSEWTPVQIFDRSSDNQILFFTGVGGVIYPRDLCCKIYQSIDNYRKDYINADDILLNYLALMNGYDIRLVNNNITFEEWWPAIANALGKANVGNGRNDKILSLAYLDLIKSKLIKL